MIYNHLYKYASELLYNLLPLKDKMKTRVDSGAADPVQYAVFLARLNKFQSSIYNLEAQAKTSLANYENTFNQVFIFQGFPKIPIIVNNDYSNKNSFELSIKENIYLSSLENVKITRSDYLPKLGISARYTEYDIDQSSDEVRYKRRHLSQIFQFLILVAEEPKIQALPEQNQMHPN